jgi:hypothetical protein
VKLLPRFYCCKEWLELEEEMAWQIDSSDFKFCPYCGSKLR